MRVHVHLFLYVMQCVRARAPATLCCLEKEMKELAPQAHLGRGSRGAQRNWPPAKDTPGIPYGFSHASSLDTFLKKIGYLRSRVWDLGIALWGALCAQAHLRVPR